MDKVKQFLAVLKKRHFWVLCGVILILSFVSWSSGKSYFSAEFSKQKGTISSKFSALQTISSTPNHPNESFATEATKIANELKEKTYAAWEQVYNAQKPELTWVEDPQMIGELPPLPEGGEGAEAVPPQEKRLLDKFFNFFSANYIPQLFSPKVINLVRPVPVVEGQEPRNEGVIIWDEAQRTAIQQRYNWEKVPTSKAIRVAQEDYWIYRSVLQTINSANAGVQETHEAAVKRILALEIAQEALASVSEAKAEMPNVTGDMIVSETTEAPKIPKADSTDEELDANRYASAVVAASSEEGGGEGGGGGGSAQYKLVPVRMELLVRESKVPDLLAACANAKLPIEVRRCTLQQAVVAKAAAGAAPAAAPGGAAAAAPAAGAAAGVADDGDVVIDIYGVIYLYNPPSKTALNMVEEAPAEGEAPVEEGV